MKYFCILILLFSFTNCTAKENTTKPKPNSVDSIFVSKSKRTMVLYSSKKKIKTYSISIGENPIGHKQQQGDNRTPEGLYYINVKNPNSKYYKNLSISYPNTKDKANAKKRKVDAGGEIKIHGYSDEKGSTKEMFTKFSYTWGCIGVCNNEMEEIYNLVKIGAKIFIVK